MKATFQGLHPVLAAKDVRTSVRFYLNLGFKVIFQDTPKTPRYAGLARDNVELHIQWADAGQWSYPTDRPAYRFVVSDVDAIYREFVKSGSINAETSKDSRWAQPKDTSWGTREFHLRDPGENILQFYHPL